MAVMCHGEGLGTLSFMFHWEHPSCFPCILSPKGCIWACSGGKLCTTLAWMESDKKWQGNCISKFNSLEEWSRSLLCLASKQMLSLPVLNGFMVKASASGHILPGQHSGLIVTSPKLGRILQEARQWVHLVSPNWGLTLSETWTVIPSAARWHG